MLIKAKLRVETASPQMVVSIRKSRAVKLWARGRWWGGVCGFDRDGGCGFRKGVVSEWEEGVDE